MGVAVVLLLIGGDGLIELLPLLGRRCGGCG